MTVITTPRLVLRPWKKTDWEPFAQMNSDPRVREFFPSVLTSEESDAAADRFSKVVDEQGWGLWAVEVRGKADFIGFLGLTPLTYEAHFTPAIEIGWRFAYNHWGQGYATEGARAALSYAFGILQLEEIVSLTAVANDRSRRVMEKIGLHRVEEDDFDHPNVAPGHPLQRHVLYRLTRSEWKKTQ